LSGILKKYYFKEILFVLKVVELRNYESWYHVNTLLIKLKWTCINLKVGYKLKNVHDETTRIWASSLQYFHKVLDYV